MKQCKHCKEFFPDEFMVGNDFANEFWLKYGIEINLNRCLRCDDIIHDLIMYDEENTLEDWVAEHE